jgi:hypothetical protein
MRTVSLFGSAMGGAAPEEIAQRGCGCHGFCGTGVSPVAFCCKDRRAAHPPHRQDAYATPANRSRGCR